MALVEKRARSPTGDQDGALIETKKPKSDALSIGAVPRTSTMHSPIMVLTGHGGEVRVPLESRVPLYCAETVKGAVLCMSAPVSHSSVSSGFRFRILVEVPSDGTCSSFTWRNVVFKPVRLLRCGQGDERAQPHCCYFCW